RPSAGPTTSCGPSPAARCCSRPPGWTSGTCTAPSSGSPRPPGWRRCWTWWRPTTPSMRCWKTPAASPWTSGWTSGASWSPLLQPVFNGVAAMHQVGLVHRGICPENIRVLENGRARLTGYATIGLRTAGSGLHGQLYEGYSAPEQYSVVEFEGRYTDVYSLSA